MTASITKDSGGDPRCLWRPSYKRPHRFHLLLLEPCSGMSPLGRESDQPETQLQAPSAALLQAPPPAPQPRPQLPRSLPEDSSPSQHLIAIT